MSYQIEPATIEDRSAAEIIYWAAKTFRSKLAITSSFQTQSMPLLHLVSRICPNVPIFFLDTGFHFRQTLDYCEEVTKDLGINVIRLEPLGGIEEFKNQHDKLYETNPNMCCYLNKVEPLKRALENYDAWISGIRRDQTSARSDTPVLDYQSDGLVKICPMVRWTASNVEDYNAKFKLPSHPLLAYGYTSIGCEPCTAPTQDASDIRSGRWTGIGKTECGLHYGPENK